MGDENPDRYMDVTDFMDVAVEAIKKHESQVDPERGEARLREGRRESGQKIGFQYAEAFRRFKLS